MRAAWMLGRGGSVYSRVLSSSLSTLEAFRVFIALPKSSLFLNYS